MELGTLVRGEVFQFIQFINSAPYTIHYRSEPLGSKKRGSYSVRLTLLTSTGGEGSGLLK